MRRSSSLNFVVVAALLVISALWFRRSPMTFNDDLGREMRFVLAQVFPENPSSVEVLPRGTEGVQVRVRTSGPHKLWTFPLLRFIARQYPRLKVFDLSVKDSETGVSLKENDLLVGRFDPLRQAIQVELDKRAPGQALLLLDVDDLPGGRGPLAAGSGRQGVEFSELAYHSYSGLVLPYYTWTAVLGVLDDAPVEELRTFCSKALHSEKSKGDILRIRVVTIPAGR